MTGVSRTTGEVSDRRLEAERALLRATSELLSEGNSLSELSVEQIAAKAGRPRTAFYLYFRDKTELLMRLTEQVAERLYSEAERWWSGAEGRRDLRAALSEILTTYRGYGDLLRAVVEASTYEERVGSFWRNLIGRFIEATRRRLIDDGVPPESASAKAFALVWMTERACYQQVATGSELADEALVDALVEIWERSVYF